MNDPIPEAFRLLSRFWLEEVRPDDLTLISALPELAQALPTPDSDTLTDLAVEYQRLFGFNLPPYESVFVDPSAMLMAPATSRVQTLYQQADWTPPTTARTGAPDHLGLELMALADWIENGWNQLARQVHTRHLALWVPAFTQALQRLAPHPFYATLGSLTLELLLVTLPPDPVPGDVDPFPDLPPPPTYHDHGMSSPPSSVQDMGSRPETGDADSPPTDEAQETMIGLRDIVRHLLTPRDAGLYLTRDDLVRISYALDLPGAMGDRSRMLETLFRLAGQYDLAPTLFDQLAGLLEEAQATYGTWADEHPVWAPYAQAWSSRVVSTQSTLNSLNKAT
jgi:TorA maturation chaperone TorD